MKTIGIRRMLTVLCAAGLLCGVLGSVTGCGAETAVGTDMPGSETVTEAVGKLSPIDFDNSALIPAILPEDQVKMETTDRLSTPDWFKSVIMVELRIGTATPEGTFEAAIPLLDHYAEMGVNCLWLTPIYEHGIGGNGYGNYGLHTLEPSLTGTNDTDEGWEVVRHFVDEAHARNIRVLFDIVTWGTMKSAPLIEEHPEFFSGGEAWGNAAFDWSSKELKEWFIGQAVDNILRTGADGYRCDCEPNYAGYKVFGEIRDRLLEKGRKIVLLAEDGNARKNAFEVEMDSVLDFTLRTRGLQYQDPMHFYLDDYNIVDSVKTGVGIGMQTLQENKKSGQSRFYTFCVSNHDYQWRVVNSNRLVIGYQALFAPFIPYWYMGDECGVTMDYQAVLYDIPVDAELIEDEAFYGDVKQMIRIRRTYPDIFEYFPDDHRKSNICAVKTSGLTKLQAYARYMGDHGIMIIPNYEKNADGSFEAVIPYGDMKLPGGVYRLTDLLTGEVLGEGEQSALASFTGVVPYEHIGVYLIQKIS
ncbi:MAG: alpha-amylase family glycosyl hydrolase [Clostridia bacterium]|nr:alpha-amylase family glycosyl hydrolase [Clostridia bacterium]